MNWFPKFLVAQRLYFYQNQYYLNPIKSILCQLQTQDQQKPRDQALQGKAERMLQEM